MFKVKPILAVMLIATLAALRPTPTQAQPLTAISATAQLTATLLSFLHSGANPYGVATLQNRQMLMSVHERLSGYDAAFRLILGRLDDLPSTMRQEVYQALDIDQIRSVRAAIQLIEFDLNAYREMMNVDPSNRPTPIADASLRLHTLQREAQRLLNHDNDLILLDALAAMHTEMAMLAMQPGYSDEQLSAAIRTRKEVYHERFREMLRPWNRDSKRSYESLSELTRQTEEQLSVSVKILDSLLSRHYMDYFDCPRPIVWCCGPCRNKTCTIDRQEIRDAYQSYRDSLTIVDRSEVFLNLYRKMFQIIGYELNDTDLDEMDRTDDAMQYEERSAVYYGEQLHDYFNNVYFAFDSGTGRIELRNSYTIQQCCARC